MDFEADPRVEQVAQAYAADLVDLARVSFGMTLDFSIESVRNVERVAEHIHATMPRFARMRPGVLAKMDDFSKGLGFYVAETIRRVWGGEHGWIEEGGRRAYGMRLPDGSICWPVGRALKRLMDGAENDLVGYVATLGEEHFLAELGARRVTGLD